MSAQIDRDADRILAAIAELNRYLGQPADSLVSVVAVRDTSGVPRADFDAAAIALSRARRVSLVPESNQKALSAAERRGAVHVGGQDKHAICLR